jgi:hypothetical protein
MRAPLLLQRFFLFTLTLTVFVACKETAPPVAPTPTIAPTAPAAPAAPDERVTAADQQCTQDSDCALTTADCCGCTSLGKQIGVRADVVAALAQRRAPVCASVSCAQSMSDDPSCTATKAVCKAGKCEPDVGGAPAMKPTPVAPIPPG